MTGLRLAQYHIDAELGRGGMGIVYKAQDTKLDRTVALKVLPPHALSSEDDRARFYREAKAAAQLHHPHIATIFQIDEAVLVEDGKTPAADAEKRPFIAMEFVDGESLAERIAKGPLKLEEAVRIATEVASALGAAHEAGVVHRDVKSGNVMLTKKGEAKVLDFGLAKTAASTQLTRQGSTLGTVAYMSPEQARGEEVDARTDLWALGVVLYEMIAGRLPFAADYEQAMLYGILNEDPEPLTAIRTGVPLGLEAIADKLLRKEARHRYQTAADLVADLGALSLDPSKSRRSASSVRAVAVRSAVRSGYVATWLAVVVGLAAAAVGLVSGLALRDAPEPGAVRRFSEPVPGLLGVDVSPDGRSYVFVARDSLWIRPFRDPEPRFLAALQDARWAFFAPDGERVGVVDRRDVRSFRIDGTGETLLGELPPSEQVQGVAWTPDGSIFIVVQFGGANGEIFRLSERGGSVESIDTLTTSEGDFSVRDIEWIPGPDVLIGAIGHAGGSGLGIVEPVELRGSPVDERLRSLTWSEMPVFAVSYDPEGILLYSRLEDTWALRVDPKSLQPVGDPFVLQSGLMWSEASGSSIMVAEERRFGGVDIEYVLLDPSTGTRKRTSPAPEGTYQFPTFSPDGRLVAVGAGSRSVVVNLERGDARRLGDSVAAISDWLPDDRGVLVSRYQDTGGSDLFVVDPSGRLSPRPLVAGPLSEFYGELSPDGGTLIYYLVDPETGRDLWTVDVRFTGEGLELAGDPQPWLEGPRDDAVPRWHPSGEWVAYSSNESGQYEVYLRSWPSGRQQAVASIGGGYDPAWSPDGRMLYYRDQRALYAVSVLDVATMRLGPPERLLEIEAERMITGVPLERCYDVHPITGEILFTRLARKLAVPEIVFVDNWKSLLPDR